MRLQAYPYVSVNKSFQCEIPSPCNAVSLLPEAAYKPLFRQRCPKQRFQKLNTECVLKFAKGEWSMCDYSLHGIENRLAEEGEILVVHRFYTGSKGLTSPVYLKPCEQPKGRIRVLKRRFAGSRVCAVCIPDGAQVVVHGISPEPRHANT